jgi:Ca-activated chloride channel family protein
VGVIEFGSGVKNRTPLRPLDDLTRQYLNDLFDGLQADGGTALIDGVYEALDAILAQNDGKAINAVVVMTDGLENESTRPLFTLDYLRRTQPDLSLVIFTIGFGDDADEVTLREIADIGDGQFRRAGETDIEELYRIISTYF